MMRGEWDAPLPEIRIVEIPGTAFTAAVCQFEDGGHHWKETTTTTSAYRTWTCRCGAIGREDNR